MSLATLTETRITTPKGRSLIFETRPDTNDAALVHGIVGEDEYLLRDLPPITGWIIDVGAHIGIVTMTLAVDHPDTKIVAVEAIPENADLVSRNVALNGLSDRVFVESAAAGAPGETSVEVIYGYEWVGVEGDVRPVIDLNYVSQCRYIGNIFKYPQDEQQAITEDRPGLWLSLLLEKYEIDRVALLKIDCEGCEYAFLRDPAIDRIDTIIGEWHGNKDGTPTPNGDGLPGIRALLDATHIVEPYGPFSLFRATHR